MGRGSIVGAVWRCFITGEQCCDAPDSSLRLPVRFTGAPLSVAEQGRSPPHAAARHPRRSGRCRLEPKDPPRRPMRPAGGRLPGRTRCPVPTLSYFGAPLWALHFGRSMRCRSRGETDERTLGRGARRVSQRVAARASRAWRRLPHPLGPVRPVRRARGP